MDTLTKGEGEEEGGRRGKRRSVLPAGSPAPLPLSRPAVLVALYEEPEKPSCALEYPWPAGRAGGAGGEGRAWSGWALGGVTALDSRLKAS